MKNDVTNLLKLVSIGTLVIIPAGLFAQDTRITPPTVPDIEIPEVPEIGIPEDIQTFLDALQTDFLAIVQSEYESAEARATAIQGWLDANRVALDELNEIEDSFDATAAVVELPEQGLEGERPEVSQGMLDIEALLAEKLANVQLDNESLKAELEAVGEEVEARVAALMEARDARLADMEAARELAKQKRDEARQNSQGDRRVDDDGTGVGG